MWERVDNNLKEISIALVSRTFVPGVDVLSRVDGILNTLVVANGAGREEVEGGGLCSRIVVDL